MTPQQRDWRTNAACLDVDPETFFPVSTSGPVYETQVAEAKYVCARCPVRDACLDYALTWVHDGIAGGLTDDERRAVRTGRARQSSRDAVQLDLGLRESASRSEVAAAGRVLLAAGRPREEVAVRCAVTRRTVDRWAASQPRETGTAVGSRGCNRAPHLISHTNPLAGTRAEGTRA